MALAGNGNYRWRNHEQYLNDRDSRSFLLPVLSWLFRLFNFLAGVERFDIPVEIYSLGKRRLEGVKYFLRYTFIVIHESGDKYDPQFFCFRKVMPVCDHG